MICERGGESDVAKVLDFGLVKDLNATESRDITQFARLLGTPAYMAPERIRDPAEAAPAVDIYAVGAVAFLLLTGRRVFEAPNEMEMTRLVLEAAPPRASGVAEQPIPRLLDDLVAACLAKDPGDRPQRVEDLVAVFDRCLREQPWSQAQATRWWQEHNAVREMAAV
jgi:serine/threonine-protein kinase